jgi:hypothetical protein
MYAPRLLSLLDACTACFCKDFAICDGVFSRFAQGNCSVKAKKGRSSFVLPPFFRDFALSDGEFTPSRQKKGTSSFVLLSTFRNFAANFSIF